jgi:hypothetical protein
MTTNCPTEKPLALATVNVVPPALALLIAVKFEKFGEDPLPSVTAVLDAVKLIIV